MPTEPASHKYSFRFGSQAQKAACLTRNIIEPPALERRSGFFRPDVFFYGHVLELTGLKDIATFLAFNELSVFIARDNTHARMPAVLLHRYLFGGPLRDRW